MKCEDCKWWVRDHKSKDWGSCHRMPPWFQDPESKAEVSEAAAYWPNTIDDDWCGEFEHK